MSNNRTFKKLTAGITAIIVLSVCLCITTFALAYTVVSVEGNVFTTGKIDINLNDSKPVISEHEFLFEPGATVEKAFFIENNSSYSVYYRLYFENVSGYLADVLQITIRDGERILYSGTASQLSKNNVLAADEALKRGERRDLTIAFHFPKSVGNSAQGGSLSFEICAEAVQTKNNPNRLFN